MVLVSSHKGYRICMGAGVDIWEAIKSKSIIHSSISTGIHGTAHVLKPVKSCDFFFLFLWTRLLPCERQVQLRWSAKS